MLYMVSRDVRLIKLYIYIPEVDYSTPHGIFMEYLGIFHVLVRKATPLRIQRSWHVDKPGKQIIPVFL
jgi:hypothetical protein